MGVFLIAEGRWRQAICWSRGWPCPEWRPPLGPLRRLRRPERHEYGADRRPWIRPDADRTIPAKPAPCQTGRADSRHTPARHRTAERCRCASHRDRGDWRAGNPGPTVGNTPGQFGAAAGMVENHLTSQHVQRLARPKFLWRAVAAQHQPGQRRQPGKDLAGRLDFQPAIAKRHLPQRRVRVEIVHFAQPADQHSRQAGIRGRNVGRRKRTHQAHRKSTRIKSAGH